MQFCIYYYVCLMLKLAVLDLVKFVYLVLEE
jgi:hypothetical protein